MLSNETPSALARSRSMSMKSCGASSRPSGRTPARTLLCAAMPSSWLRAATSAAWPLPPRSWSRNEKPVAVPSSGIAGGTSAKTKASRTPASAPKARPARRLRRMLGALALVPRLERNEGERRVLAAAGEREAEHADHLVDLGLAQEEASRPAASRPASGPASHPAAAARWRSGSPGPRSAGTTSACAMNMITTTATISPKMTRKRPVRRRIFATQFS